MNKEALFYVKSDEDKTVACRLCPHHCRISPGKTGLCRVRRNKEGVLYAEGYGLVSSLALDPIEKKPLRLFRPGGMILSVGGIGCNLRCPFCQNCEISTIGPGEISAHTLTPNWLVEQAAALVAQGNIGLAYTYNEPFMFVEFMLDCAKALKEKHPGLANVIVTNGCVSEAALSEILPYTDAMNIDLKSFDPVYYQKIGGNLETVKANIATAAKHCHVEVTTLITPTLDAADDPFTLGTASMIPADTDNPNQDFAPGEWMSEKEMDSLALFLAQTNPSIPLHITRCYPRHKMRHTIPTPLPVLSALTNVARRHLQYVYGV